MATAYHWDEETRTLTPEGEDKFMTAFTWTNLLTVSIERAKCFGCPAEIPAGEGRLWNVKNAHYDLRIALCQDCHGKMIITPKELAMQTIEIHEGREAMKDAQDDRY